MDLLQDIPGRMTISLFEENDLRQWHHISHDSIGFMGEFSYFANNTKSWSFYSLKQCIIQVGSTGTSVMKGITSLGGFPPLV